MTDADHHQSLAALFDAATLSTLEAAFDTLIPATTEATQPSAGGWLGGVQQLLAEHIPGFMDWAIEPLKAAAAALLSQDPAFATLPANERSAVVTAVEATAQGQPLVEHLVTIAYQGYYGGTREVAGWGVVGFTDVPPAATALDEDPLTGIPASALREHYDVVVIGGGAGGGVAANELAQAGYSVLIVERARPFRDRDLRGNHLQGKRADLYSSVVGPGPGHPRVLENADGSTELLPGEGTGNNYGLVAMALGGGTRVWQGMAWRFYDEDFAMASIYGVPPGSTLADWPFGYDELEPYYSRVEWELGVSGDATSAMSRRTRRSRDYPMPALPDDDARRAYSRAATALGWEASPIPFSINSVARDGRAACVRCAQCIGHACPVNAKNGTHTTFIPRALATGRCDLLMSAQATFIEHDGRGTATAVRVVVETVDGPVERTIRADRVVVSAGAIETPRLLLVSGLGNDWVGRNHQSHGFAVAHALAGTSPKELIGPGHSVASVDWVHRDRLAWGGGVLFDLPNDYPVMKAEFRRRFGFAAWGAEHKAWMRDSPPTAGAMSMVQEIPHELTRVSADPAVKDRYGMPVARVRGEPHPATMAAAEFMAARAAEWTEAVGGRDVRSFAAAGGARGAEHSAGTARLGSDPAHSATDERGQVWGTSNVFVADASLHPTNGGFNPGLTAMANAMRVADLMTR